MGRVIVFRVSGALSVSSATPFETSLSRSDMGSVSQPDRRAVNSEGSTDVVFRTFT
jgi:hypothetical protein